MTPRRRGWSWSVSVFPAAGLAVAGLMAGLPGSPVGPARWPARGTFGAFTWLAWFLSTWLGLTLLFLAIVLIFRHVRIVTPGRIVSTALAFGLLSLASYASAARAAWIARHPALALAVAVMVLVALRVGTRRRRQG